MPARPPPLSYAFSQPPRLFIEDLNHFLANSRIRDLIARRFKQGGLCHGMAIASIMVDDFEKMVFEFQAATEIERTTRGTPAWMLGYRLAYLLAATHNMSMPFDDVYFSKQPQTRSYAHLSLKQLGKYSVTFNANNNTITYLLQRIESENTPISLLFMFAGHTIRLKYENNQFNVYDTVEPSRQFTDKEAAEKYIFSKFLELQKLPQELKNALTKMNTDNIPVSTFDLVFGGHIVQIKYENHQFTVYDNKNSSQQFDNQDEAEKYIYSKFLDASSKIRFDATIEILKKESDTSPNPDNLLSYLIYASYYSRRLIKVAAPIIKHKIQIDDFLYVPDIPMKWFREEMEKYPYLGGLLQTMPALSAKTVLEDPFFRQRFEQIGPYKPKVLDEIIKHYKNEPEKRLIATCLYLLVKKHNIPLEENIIIDFKNYGDPTLLRLLNAEQLIKVINTTDHLQTKKIALEAYSKLITNERTESVKQSLTINDLSDWIYILYFQNNLELAQSFIEQFREHPEFISKIPNMISLVSFAIQDKKNDWLEMLHTIPFTFKLEDFFSFLKIAIVNENKPAFAQMLKIILQKIRAKEINFQKLIELNPFAIAACECSSEFLSSMIEQFRTENRAALLPLLINVRTPEDESVLHQLVFQGKTKHIEILLKAGASQGLSKQNETPFYLACVFGHVEIARLLFNAHFDTAHTMPPIPDKPNLPYLRNVFAAAKNSDNPDMLDEVIKLFSKRNSLEEISNFPLQIIPYFLEYFEKNNDFISLMFAADYLIEKYPVENLLALESTYLRETLQNRKLSDIDQLYEVVNVEIPPPPEQPQGTNMQPSLPRTLHAYSNSNNRMDNILKHACSVDAFSSEGSAAPAKRQRNEINKQLEQSTQNTQSYKRKHCALEDVIEQEAAASKRFAPEVNIPALLMRC